MAVAGTSIPRQATSASSCRSSRRCWPKPSRPSDLTAIFSRYNVAGAMAGALGALASGFPRRSPPDHANAAAAERSGFIAYAISP